MDGVSVIDISLLCLVNASDDFPLHAELLLYSLCMISTSKLHDSRLLIRLN
jgi:hypothetical protein